MNAVCRFFSCFAATLIGLAQGATGDFDLMNERATDFLPDIETEESPGLWQRFHQAYNVRANEVFADRLHPLKVMELSIRHPGDSWEQWVDHGDRAVESAFCKSIEYSLRDASLKIPLLGWLETSQDALVNFLVDSVDAVEEESVAPSDISYGAAERSWWKNLSEKRALRFGLRPLSSSPYAYLGMRLQEAGKTLLLGNIRYYLKNFTDHRFELSFSIPLAGGAAFDLGTFYQFGQNEIQRRLVVKIFKPLRNGGVAHLGVEVQKTPVVFAGISMPL